MLLLLAVPSMSARRLPTSTRVNARGALLFVLSSFERRALLDGFRASYFVGGIAGLCSRCSWMGNPAVPRLSPPLWYGLTSPFPTVTGPTVNPSAVTRRLAAILIADVVGFSRHMERDDAGAFARPREIRERIIDPRIAEHRFHS